MALNKASKDHHIDNQYTSLVLIGGVDVNKDFISKAVDLRVEGGALIRKQLLVLGNICTNNTILGTFEGDVVTSKITAKELTEGITVIGNLCGHPDNFFKSNIITNYIKSDGDSPIIIEGDVNFNGNLSGVTVDDVITDVVTATSITSNTITSTTLTTETLYSEFANITSLESKFITTEALNVANVFVENLDALCGNIGNVHKLEVNYISHKTQDGLLLGNTQSNVIVIQSPLALQYPTSTPSGGDRNLFLGYDAGLRTLSEANDNTFIGYNAGLRLGNVTGSIVIGSKAVGNSTSNMDDSIALGRDVLGNATGDTNRTVVIGSNAMNTVILGRDSVVIGYGAAEKMYRMYQNVFIGKNSGEFSYYSFKNIAIGGCAMQGNLSNPTNINFYNVGIGYGSMRNVDTGGYRNVVIGHEAGSSIMANPDNILVGYKSDVNTASQMDSIAIGSEAIALKSRDVQLGAATSGTTGNLYFREQLVSSESWKDGELALASIDGGGNIIKGNVDLNDVLANIMFGDTLTSNVVCANVVITDKLQAKPGGNIEVCGNLIVEGNIIVVGNGTIIGGADPQVFRVEKSGAPQALPSGSSGIDVMLGMIDINNINSPGSWSGDTFTIYNDGWYHLNASSNFGNAIDNKFSLEFYINGLATKCVGHSQYHATSSNALCSIDCTVYLESSDTITLKAKQYTGSPQSIIDGHFSIFRLNGAVNTEPGVNIEGTLNMKCNDIEEVGNIYVKDNVVIGDINNTTALGTTGSIAIGGNAVCTEDNSIALGTDILADQPGGFFVQHRFGPFTVRNAGFDTGNTTNELVEVTSSIRFKENVRELEDVREKMLKLRPVRYTGKPGFGDNREHIGLIAEELNEIFPEFVSYDPNSTTPRGIMYDHMIAILIKELQRLSKENEEMKESLSKLEMGL